jgi:hypothetical protein
MRDPVRKHVCEATECNRSSSNCHPRRKVEGRRVSEAAGSEHPALRVAARPRGGTNVPSPPADAPL